jgi:hypothetical protein
MIRTLPRLNDKISVPFALIGGASFLMVTIAEWSSKGVTSPWAAGGIGLLSLGLSATMLRESPWRYLTRGLCAVFMLGAVVLFLQHIK